MNQFEITNYYNGSNVLLETKPVYTAQTGAKALRKFLKDNNIHRRVKVTGGNEVHFCVTPICFVEGTKCIDGSKRIMWYKIVD